jgi:transposase-like protein
MKNDRNHHSLQTSAEITALISRYRRSGVGLARFAREHGIPAGRLHYWVYQKQASASARPPSRPTRAAVAPIFQEVKLTAQTPLVESWAAEVDLPHGGAVRFSPAATAEWIGSVVQTLQRPC